jgi:hypothetical protein
MKLTTRVYYKVYYKDNCLFVFPMFPTLTTHAGIRIVSCLIVSCALSCFVTSRLINLTIREREREGKNHNKRMTMKREEDRGTATR